MMIELDQMILTYREFFRLNPQWTSRAPGRVNLIGEHTDYSGGFVLPAAIDHHVRLIAGPSKTNETNLRSILFKETWSADLTAVKKPLKPGSWPSYYAGVAAEFRKLGYKVPHLNVLIDGIVPAGAGLSSSAAFEVAVATLLNMILKANLSQKDIALLSQRAENGPYVGVNCGIMDQYASAHGEQDRAILLDCYSLEHEMVEFDSSKAKILIINSMKKRGLVDSQYNLRRQQCQQGLDKINELTGENYPSLRHIPAEAFEAVKNQLDENVIKRVRHNITENQRVHEFADALKTGNVERLGQLLYESHASLRDDFEVSCRELDLIVQLSKEIDDVYGCRMTGAGFGGCCVALIKPSEGDQIVRDYINRYQEELRITPECYLTDPGAGADAQHL